VFGCNWLQEQAINKTKDQGSSGNISEFLSSFIRNRNSELYRVSFKTMNCFEIDQSGGLVNELLQECCCSSDMPCSNFLVTSYNAPVSSGSVSLMLQMHSASQDSAQPQFPRWVKRQVSNPSFTDHSHVRDIFQIFKMYSANAVSVKSDPRASIWKLKLFKSSVPLHQNSQQTLHLPIPVAHSTCAVNTNQQASQHPESRLRFEPPRAPTVTLLAASRLIHVDLSPNWQPPYEPPRFPTKVGETFPI
jgi:hypothetical protein